MEPGRNSDKRYQSIKPAPVQAPVVSVEPKFRWPEPPMYPISIDPATGTIRYIGIKDRLRVYRLAKLWQCPPSVVRQETYLDQEIALLNEQALNLFDRENSERIQKEMNSGSGSGSGSGGSKPGNKPTLEQGRQRDEARAAALLAD